jgi:hypothetical protein
LLVAIVHVCRFKPFYLYARGIFNTQPATILFPSRI